MSKTNRIVFSFIVTLFCLAHVSFAGDMRSITITSMLQYSDSLYKRGNYDEAASVVKRMIQLDANNPDVQKLAQALAQKGYDFPAMAQTPKKATKVEKVVREPEAITPKVKTTVIKPQVQETPTTVIDYSPIIQTKEETPLEPAPTGLTISDELRKQIALKDQALSQLKAEIGQLKEDISRQQQAIDSHNQ